MLNDPIVEELRKIREAHAARFNYDLRAICEDLRKQEQEAERQGQQFITLPPRRIERQPVR